MTNLNPYKRGLLDKLLGFCYPADNKLTICDPATLDTYPHTDKLRRAILDILHANIGKLKLRHADSIAEWERASNEPVTYRRSWKLPSGEPSFMKQMPIGRMIADHLAHFLDETGKVGAICERCQKVFLPKRHRNQRYCSDKCRWDYWNAKAMAGYYAKKLKAAREHVRRMKALKGGKH